MFIDGARREFVIADLISFSAYILWDEKYSIHFSISLTMCMYLIMIN